jgi:phosphatidate cytidylyltransferase
MESSLAWRLGLSAVFIPALFGLFYVDHKAGEAAPALFAFCLAISIRSAWELGQLLTTRNISPRWTWSAAGCAALLFATWQPHLQPQEASFSSLELLALGFAMITLVLLGVEAASFRQPGRTVERLGANLLITTYAGVLLAVTAQLRWAAGAQAGYLLLGSLIIPAKMGDIGAYTLGRLFGKRKMAPRLSPGKTWAGFLGALLGGALGAGLWLTFAPPLFDSSWSASPLWAAVVYGVVIGFVGLAGDLCESLIKRDVGRKDSAPLMPGFGGLLDLLDSVLYAGPAALVLWHVLPLKTW